MDRTLKALSLLLSYPSPELQQAMPTISSVLGSDGRIAAKLRRGLRSLADSLAVDDLIEVQERYVSLFDRSRTLSLCLFEHVHGESRDRGGAMVSLLETYRDGGFELSTSELPDHLPVLLEFLSTRSAKEARETLADAAHILQALAERLNRRASPYATVFAALLQIADSRADAGALAELRAVQDVNQDDLEALDAAWEETEVRFGADPNSGCPQVRGMLSRMERPVDRRAVS